MRAEDVVAAEAAKMPPFFTDLNLDQLVDAITAGKEEYNLKPFFYFPLHDADTVNYRHEVMRDFEEEAILQAVRSFGSRMHQMREHLAQAAKLYYPRQKQSWFLDAVGIYRQAVTGLAFDLGRTDPKSRGLIAFTRYLRDYIQSDAFKALCDETDTLTRELAAISYGMVIRGNCITVQRAEPGPDYGKEVEAAFQQFRQGETREYRARLSIPIEMNHVEAGILDRVAKLYPNEFAHLADYCTRNEGYLDPTIAAFDREVQFYIAYLVYSGSLKRSGLSFCYPTISETSMEVFDYDGFDLTLADRLVTSGDVVVPNDFWLSGEERVLVVSGPNQGGKTTFARTFGQIHYLASIGCPVPGRSAQLFLCDQIFTHFEREENIDIIGGKLEDELIRIHEILERATSRSIIIINEMLTSTTLRDAIYLGEKIMERILKLDALCVWVTFVDELATLSPKIVSLISTVDQKDPARRTYRIVRHPADGLSYALSLVEKHRLTYKLLKERISQ